MCKTMHYFIKFIILMSLIMTLDGHYKNLAWNGGPINLQCEKGLEYWVKNGQYERENIIVTKAISFNNDIYVISPRMKKGVIATLWIIGHGKNGVELQPYPELRIHKIGDCSAIQNAVDFYLDHLGKLWILDSGMVETLLSPQCTCPPKVVVINLLLGKRIKNIDISSLLESNSLLQNIVVEHTIGGKTFIYTSDASRGAILVHELNSGSQWSVVACRPAAGLQIALIKQRSHSVLVIVRLHHQGIIELNTAALRRKDSLTPLTVSGEQSMPVVLLGADNNHVYLRHTECSDVLVWDTRHTYNGSKLKNIHSAGPRLTTTAVTAVPLKPLVLILDSNYLDTLHTNTPTYHKITFINCL